MGRPNPASPVCCLIYVSHQTKQMKCFFFLNFSSIKFQVIMQPVISVARRVEVSLSPQCYYIELGHQWSPKEGTHAKK